MSEEERKREEAFIQHVISWRAGCIATSRMAPPWPREPKPDSSKKGDGNETSQEAKEKK